MSKWEVRGYLALTVILGIVLLISAVQSAILEQWYFVPVQLLLSIAMFIVAALLTGFFRSRRKDKV